MDTTGLKKVYDADGTTRYVKDPNYKPPSKTKAASGSKTKSGGGGGKRQAATVAKGKPYKGQSSKKAVRNTFNKVAKRQGVSAQATKKGFNVEQGTSNKAIKSTLKQARRIVRARKANK
jgi:hypothetical protein